MNTAQVLIGDALTMLRTLPDASVHCCVTSPPYFGLRDYGTATWVGGDEGCEHKEKNGRNDVDASSLARRAAMYGTGTDNGSKVSAIQYRHQCPKCGAVRVDNQIGLEATPEQYVARLVDVFREVRRVLRRDGTLWLNVGDSYAANRGYQVNGTKQTAGSQPDNGASVPPGLKPKDLIGIPWRLAFALQADGWWLRSDVIWHKPNPMPESVTDRPTKAHEYLFLLAKAERYYYDAQAIAEPIQQSSIERIQQATFEQQTGGPKDYRNGINVNRSMRNTLENFANNTTGTRNRRSVWTVATEPTPYAHFATMPTALVEPCVMAGTSAHGVCPACGAPWARVVEKERNERGGVTWEQRKAMGEAVRRGFSQNYSNITGAGNTFAPVITTTTGWTPTCECDAGAPVPATVLDPFAGSGTTLRAAVNLGRNAIGIELNPEYAALAERLLAQTQPALLPL